MRLYFLLLVLAPLLSSLTFTRAAAPFTVLEIAPDQGCILVVAFQVTTKDTNSTEELRIVARNSWPVCGYGSNSPDGKHQVMKALTENLTYPDIFVAYGGMLPLNDGTQKFTDFPLCAIGPQSLMPGGNGLVTVPIADQGVPMDGSYPWYSSDHMYNASIPDSADPTSFPMIRECHPRGDRLHLDSAVFANDEEILNMLPNPYGSQIQSEGTFIGSDWASKTVTVQLSSATIGTVGAKRTVPASRPTTFGVPSITPRSVAASNVLRTVRSRAAATAAVFV